MNFNVSKLMREPSGSQRSYQVDERVPTAGTPDVLRVRGAVRLLRTDGGVWVSAGLDSEVPCDCVRCLAAYIQPVHIEVEEEFFPQPEQTERAAKSDDLYSEEHPAIDQDNILDMTEVIQQYTALSLPMKPVCRPDCKGICLTCGADLNLSTCSCDKEPVYGRWAPLADVAFRVEKN